MSDKVVKLIEDVKSLTVLELSELVKALEEEFGVSATPVAVAGAVAGGDDAAAADALRAGPGFERRRRRSDGEPARRHAGAGRAIRPA